MQTVSVPVIRAFEFDGREVLKGEILTVSPVMAAVLHRQGVVSLTRQPKLVRKVIAPEPEPAKPIRTRRPYKRRDMRAED